MALTASDREAVLKELDLAAFDMDKDAKLANQASAPKAAERLVALSAETDRCRDALFMHGDRAERKVKARLHEVRAEWARVRASVPALGQQRPAAPAPAPAQRAAGVTRKGTLMALHSLALSAGWNESDWQSAYEELRKGVDRRTPEIGHGNKKAEIERRSRRMARLRTAPAGAPVTAGSEDFTDLVDLT